MITELQSRYPLKLICLFTNSKWQKENGGCYNAYLVILV